ncbi:MAG: hypothetical protein IKN43_12135 [Selenomonadaceae bacterium]|nr:hypothetical protein [Selenomonadaceae bacterium]
MIRMIEVMEKAIELAEIPAIRKNLDKMREDDPTMEKGITYLYNLAEKALEVNRLSKKTMNLRIAGALRRSENG